MAISWDDFIKVDIRVGTVISATTFPEARKPAYRLEIDFGPEKGILRSSAQITTHYATDDLIGRQVIAVVNFPEKSIAGFKSQCLVLGVYDANNDVILLKPDKATENGRKIG